MASGNGIPQQVGMAGPQGQLKQDTMHRGTAYPVGMCWTTRTAGPQGQLKQDTMHRGEAFPVIDMAEGRERGIAGSWVLDASGELRQRTGSGPQQPLTQGQPAGGGGKAGGVPQQQQAPNINQSAAAGIQGARLALVEK
jgi:hypothetical protein